MLDRIGLKLFFICLISVLLCSIILVYSPSYVLAADDYQYRIKEIGFTSVSNYNDPFDFTEVDFKVTFSGPDSATMVVPGFWDGGSMWKVRFMPTKAGTWNYTTTCSNTSDTGLHNQSGSFTALTASGTNPVYLHGGMLKVSSNGRNLTYTDGTPFFYLADTWWTCPTHLFDFDGPSGHPDEEVDAFKYLVDKRVSQNYTIWQHHGWRGLPERSDDENDDYGLSTSSDSANAFWIIERPEQQNNVLDYWREYEKYYQYATDQGLIGMAGFAGSSYFSDYSTDDLKKLFRYHLARVGSYATGYLITQEYNLGFVNPAISIRALRDGKIKYYDNDGIAHELQNYSADTWYHFRIVADTETDKADIYINDVLKGNQLDFRNTVDNIGIFTMSGGVSDMGYTAYWDDISVNSAMNDNFEDGNIDDWELDTGEGSTIDVVTLDNDKAIRLYDNSVSNDLACKRFTEQSGTVVIEFDFRRDSTNKDLQVCYLYNSEGSPTPTEKSMQMGEFIDSIDPYDRVLSIHPASHILDNRRAWDESWYDCIMYQGGHGRIAESSFYNNDYTNYNIPMLEAENNYEGFNRNYCRDAQGIRQTAYNAIQSGCSGYGYGASGLYGGKYSNDYATSWGYPYAWWEAIEFEGGADMQHLYEVYNTVEWWNLEPKFEAVTNEPEILVKANSNEQFLVWYPPNASVASNAQLTGVKRNYAYSAKWFNTSNGDTGPIPDIVAAGETIVLPERPNTTQDWMLVLQLKKYCEIDDDFEDGNLDEWILNAGAGSVIDVVTLDNSNVMRMYDNSTSEVKAVANFMAQSSVVVTEFDFRSDSTNKDMQVCYLFDLANNNAVSIRAMGDGNFKYFDGSAYYTLHSYSSDIWYHFKVVTYTGTDKVDIYIDDVLKGSNLNLRSAVDNLSKIEMSGGSTQTGYTCYWDNLKIYEAVSSDDFEDGNLDEWTLNVGTGSSIEVATLDNNNVMKMHDNSTTEVKAARNFTVQSGVVVTEFDFRRDSTNKDMQVCYIYDSLNSNAVSIRAMADGNFKYYDGSVYHTLQSYSVGNWYHFKAVTYTGTDKVDIYIDDVLKGSALNLRNAVDNLSKIEMSGGVTQTGYTCYWDNIKVY